jgi:phosphoribosyl 1,2-cyclic phosphodiesterase
MCFWFSVLGSGSGGNCTGLVFEAQESAAPGPADSEASHASPRRRCALIDVGLSPRATARRLQTIDLTLRDVCAIILTHLDGDHFHAGWLKIIEKLDLPVHAHHRHRGATYAAGIPVRRTSLFNGELRLDGGIESPRMESLVFAHDALGSVGFVIEHRGRRLGFATDLGRVPESLFERFVDLHGLAIESNYDRQMQLDSGRPWFLKRRIMGGMGHLSNEQTLEAVERIEAQSHLSQIALLHRSQQCNCPELLRELYTQKAPHLVDRLTLTEQHQPTPLLEVKVGVRRGSPKKQSPREPLTLFG